MVSPLKKTVYVAAGGYSSEHDISIKSGLVVCEHLDKNEYDVYLLWVQRLGWQVIRYDGFLTASSLNEVESAPAAMDSLVCVLDNETIRPDVIFNTIHGNPGENGLFAAYCETIRIPQSSCNFYESALTFNKRDTLAVVKQYNIPTAVNYLYNKGDEINPEAIVNTVGLPCFVKANRAGSSYGITRVKTIDQLPVAIEIALKEDHQILIESQLTGTEVSVGVIPKNGDVEALAPTAILSENEFFDYEAKYLGKSQEITPAEISKEDTAAVQNLAVKIYRILNLKGIARADFIFHEGKPHFIEINTTPGLSEQSIIPQQVRHAGYTLTEFFSNIIKDTLN